MLFETVTILLSLLSISSGQDSKIVTIAQGPVRGYKALDSEVYEYFGIPYATTPTGSNKFKAPLPAPTWTDVFDAVENNIACPQNQFLAGDRNIKDDCLVANVFAPNTQATNLSVVVYIHGGAYFFGDGLLMSPKPLVESQKVVAVTINYRLGVYGFLCLGTEDIPGNAGLRDMIAALRWVKENIAQFGGNPDDVTLAGNSAGAAAADLLSLSKFSKGLFNKLIMESGVHVTYWNVQKDPIKNAQEYARKLNFDNVGSLTDLEEFYKTSPQELLLSDISMLFNFDSNFIFVPCIENDLGQERILHDSPINIIKSGENAKLPAFYGFANMEGMFRMPLFDTWAPNMNEKFSDFLPLDLKFEDESVRQEVSQKIKEFYFGSSSVGLYTLFDYINYFTDTMYAYPTQRSIKLQVEAGNEHIFLYEYTFYKKFLPVAGVPDILTNFPGANHCDQSDAVLINVRTSDEERYTEEYKQVRVNLRELWINFITTGTPVLEDSSFPSWPAVNTSGSPHMILGDTIELGGVLHEDRFHFWDDIYDKYYSHPIPPVFEESGKNNNADMIAVNVVPKLLLLSVLFFVSY